MATASPLSPKNPETLLRDLVVIAIVSMLIILSLTTYGIYRVYARHVIDSAESDAVGIGKALLETEREVLLAPGTAGPSRLALTPESIPLLDQRLRLFLRPFDIVKIKIYAPDGTIVYSTDPKIIGRVDRDNTRLAHALAGFIDTKLERKEEVIDLADERKFDVDVVETYLPIRDPVGSVVGSFEVYIDVTRSRGEIRDAVLTSTVVLGGILFSVFGLSFLLVRKATWRLRQAQEALETMASTDVLTGLANRRRILARAEEEMQRYVREREVRPVAPLSLLMLDLDHFKECNDTYGHLVGDQVMREIAGRLAGCIRRYDVAGRFGGEEFMVILPAAGFAEAWAIAERIRRAVRERPFEIDGMTLVITVSIGVSCARPQEKELQALLHRADVALYLAKERGRDRVAWVEGEGGTEVRKSEAEDGQG